ncbi:MAG TPA: hypothetical protein VGG83_29200 [Trebonia sp.]|jgi:hypothetical protein
MSSIMWIVIVCAPILVAWMVVCAPWYLARRRARRRVLREEAQWLRLRAGHRGLDADLNGRTAAEDERIKRHP